MRRICGIVLIAIAFTLDYGAAWADSGAPVPIVAGAAPTPAVTSSPSLSQAPTGAPPVAATKTVPQALPSAMPTSVTSKLPQMLIVITPTQIAEPIGQVGVTTSVVTAKQIQTQQLNTVVDALRQVPGVNVVQSGSPGSLAEVFIRGADPSQTLIMIDGVPVNDSASSEFDISRITTGGLDQIEVVRGAGGSLYGSEAIGGVVNIISQEGSGPMHFSLLSEGGNRATQNQEATVSGAEGHLAYAGALTYFSTTGFRPINDNSDNLSGNMRLDYHLDENTTIRGFARYTRANVSLASYSDSLGIPLNPNAHQRTEFMLFKGEIDRQVGEHLAVHTSAFFVRDDIRLNEVPFADSNEFQTDSIPDETRGNKIDAVYSWNSQQQSLLGFEFLDRWVHSGDNLYFPAPPPPASRYLTIFNARRQEYAGYFEQVAHLFNDHIIGTGGFRVDGNSQFGEEVSPAWSVAIPFQPYGLTLRGNYAEGFRAPSFDELYFPDFGNPNLGPELSSEYDGGFTKTFGELASLTTTYFSRRVHDEIVTVPCKVGPGCQFGSTAGNARRVDTQGVEVAPEVHPVKGLDLGGSFTYIDQRHEPPLFAIQPLRVPKYAAEAHVQLVHSNLIRSGDQATAVVLYTFVGDRDDIEPSGTIANHAAYNRVDLAFSYSPKIKWRMITDEQLVARVQNALDRHYEEAFGFPSPPINFLAGVKFDF